MKIKAFLIPSIVLLIGSCSGSKTVNEGYYFQDFENFSMWLDEAPKITNEFSRNGYYSLKVDEKNLYSQCFRYTLKELRDRGYTKASVTAWGAMAVPAAKCSLVVSIEAPDKALEWQGASVTGLTKNVKEWVELKTSVLLDKGSDTDLFKVYAISADGKAAYFDDFTIEFSK